MDRTSEELGEQIKQQIQDIIRIQKIAYEAGYKAATEMDEQKIQQLYDRLQKAELDVTELQIDLKRLKDVVELHLQLSIITNAGDVVV